MIASLITFLSSSAFGAITGLVGSYLTKREDRLNRIENYKHEINLKNIQMEYDRQKHSQEIELADKQIEKEQVVGELSAFTESQKNDRSWGDRTKGIIRPLVTVYLCSIATYFAYEITTLVGGLDVIPASELVILYKGIISEVLYLTALVISWWFGARPQHKK